MDACNQIKHRTKLDHYGMCVDSIRLFVSECPQAAVAFFEMLLSSSPIMSTIEVNAKLFGNESPRTPASKLRAILPLPAVLQVADALLANLLLPCIDSVLPVPAGSFIGARKHTQPLDIAHELHLVIEKSLDVHSVGGIAQQDIATYYDKLQLLLVGPGS